MNTTATGPVFASIARIALGGCALLSFSLAEAQVPSASRQDHASVYQAVRQFLLTETVSLAGDISIEVHQMDRRLSLSACSALHAFLPIGTRPWGKTTVGVRCNAPSAWTIYVAATVKVHGEYYVAAKPLVQGQAVEAEDLAPARGDLAALPAGIVTELAQAVGYVVTRPVKSGMPLRQEALRQPPVVQQGQVVRIILNGPGFSIATEGRALTGAAEGQLVQARTANGQMISGLAKAGGIIAVAY